MIEIEEYEAMRRGPDGNPVMYQNWRSLLFMHFACEPEEIQKLLPPGLTIDTFPDDSGKEKAWIGLVPFRMEKIRRVGLPPIPGFSAFPETNVRTYVHKDGHEPGVWFFSLDAANGTACSVARNSFKLPYHKARMKVMESEDSTRYESTRASDGRKCNTVCHVTSPKSLLKPGSLDFFLIERYALHALRGDRLVVGRVFHKPYRLYAATVDQLDENLVEAVGITPRPFEHFLFSYGVEVEVYPLSR